VDYKENNREAKDAKACSTYQQNGLDHFNLFPKLPAHFKDNTLIFPD